MISKQIKVLYRNTNHFTGGRLDILKNTLKSFSKVRASQAAASLAYYAIFSLFPLLLVLIASGSTFLNSQQVFESVTRLVQDTLPISPQLVNENLRQVLDARGAVGTIGLLTLLWSASGFFSNLAYNINLAWTNASRRNFFEKRLIGLGMIVGLSGLLILSLSLEWITSLIPFFNSDTLPPLNRGLWRLASEVASWLTIFLLFLALYRWVPTSDVHWSATFWGALITSIAWKAATAGFSWYLSSGLGSYSLVYGSLGTIVALLFLIFIVSWITLFGAHLSATIDRRKRDKIT